MVRPVQDQGATVAKKTAARRKETAEDDGRVAFQVRFDRDLQEQLKQQAEEAGLSLNQLIQGICRTASRYLVQGEPHELVNGFIDSRPMKRCVFFGRRGEWGGTPEEVEQWELDTGELPPPRDKGFLLFSLDFTDRGAAFVPGDIRKPGS